MAGEATEVNSEKEDVDRQSLASKVELDEEMAGEATEVNSEKEDVDRQSLASKGEPDKEMAGEATEVNSERKDVDRQSLASKGEPDKEMAGEATEVNSEKEDVDRQSLASDEQAVALENLPSRVEELENPEVTSSVGQGQRKVNVHDDGKKKVKGNQKKTPSASSETEMRSHSHKTTKPRGTSKRGRGWQATKKVSRK
jgi:hypothetical protein